MRTQNIALLDGFWDRLEETIYSKNRTKKDVARQCGFDRKILNKRKNSYIILPYFARLCSALNVSADYLLFGERGGEGDRWQGLDICG